MLDGPRVPLVRSFSTDLTTGVSRRANLRSGARAALPSAPSGPLPRGRGAPRVLVLPTVQVPHQLVDGIGVSARFVLGAEDDLRPPTHPHRNQPTPPHPQAVPGDRVDDDPLVARARQLL